MRTVIQLCVAGVWVLLAGLPLAGAATESALSEVARFYGLVGEWQGQGTTNEGGRQSQLGLRLQCEKVSDGWGVLCRMDGIDPDGRRVLAETGLFGVDPVSGVSHWYAVNNAGETHDHRVTWRGPDTMLGAFDWRQDGKAMAERIVFDLSSTVNLDFRSVLSADGQEIAGFTGALHKQ